MRCSGRSGAPAPVGAAVLAPGLALAALLAACAAPNTQASQPFSHLHAVGLLIAHCLIGLAKVSYILKDINACMPHTQCAFGLQGAQIHASCPCHTFLA